MRCFSMSLTKIEVSSMLEEAFLQFTYCFILPNL